MKKRDIIYSCLLVLPFCLHWLMPDGLERSFYVNILGIPFFVPNICYFLYLINYKKHKRSNEQIISIKRLPLMKLILLFLVLYTVLISVANDIDGLMLVMCNNQSLIFSAFIYLLFPLPNRLIKHTKYAIIPTALLLCLEVILFSLGILHYELDLGNLEYGGITRISTTVGAATGTAVAIGMLGAIIITCYEIPKIIKIPLILLLSVSILYTVSRGTILLWGLFIFIFVYKTYYSRSKLIKRVELFVVASIFSSILYWMGAFNPVNERNDEIGSNYDTGRIERIESAFDVFKSSNGLGIGSGQTKLEKSIADKTTCSVPLGIHNYYLSSLVELGVVGLSLIIIILLIIISNFNFKKPISFFSILLLIITFSTEPVFIYEEFMAPAFFIFMLSIRKNYENSIYNNA